MKKTLTKMTAFLIAFLVIFSFTQINIVSAAPNETKSNIIIVPEEAMRWFSTNKVTIIYQYELYKRDYSSKLIQANLLKKLIV